MTRPTRTIRLAPTASRAPLVSVLVVIFTVVDGKLRALLIHRSGEPYKGRWPATSERAAGAMMALRCR